MEKIKCEFLHDGEVAQVVLCDAKGNVLDNIMMIQLLELLEQFKQHNDLKLITFEGEGKHFSFGASVEEHTKDRAEAMLKTFHKIFYKLMDLGIPTLAKVSGQCLGGGMELALMCNFIFADETAVFGQPEINLGVFPPPASIILPLKIGYASAEEVLITGRSIDAKEAEKLGLLNNVSPDKSELEKQCDEWIKKQILPKSASSLRFGVKAARTFFNDVLLDKLVVVESMYLNQLMETKDANEGINSFLENRKPEWENA